MKQKTLDIVYLHNHTDRSNFRLLDCTNKVDKLIDKSIKYGGKGVAITDHEALSAHVEAIQYVKEGKSKGSIPKDFKLILGNEIYLVDSLEEVRDNYEHGETKFYHFILLAKDKIGYDQLRRLSTLAWQNSFRTGKMERVPTIKSDLEEIVTGGHIIGSTACLGGELPHLILQLIEAEKQYNKVPTKENEANIQNKKIKIHQFITWCMRVFGEENFFIEIQPNLKIAERQEKYRGIKEKLDEVTFKLDNHLSLNVIDDEVYKEDLEAKLKEQQAIINQINEQTSFNKRAIEIAKAYELDWIVTTDTHYLEEVDRGVHSAYLNSKEGDRETSAFYATTHLMTSNNIQLLLKDYLLENEVVKAITNTLKIGSMIEEYDLYHPVLVPEITPPDFELNHLFSKYYDKFSYIKNFAYSDNIQDRYYLYLVEEGLKKKEPFFTLSNEEYKKILNRINIELQELWLITKEINIHLSSYYITVREIINIMWDEGDSLVGISRGSVTGWYTAYLLDIMQMNPLQWELPHWRHLDTIIGQYLNNYFTFINFF